MVKRMHPCQEGYACKYAKCDTCVMLCPMSHVTIEGKEGEYAYDSLTGELHPWVIAKHTPQKPKPDPVDAWYDEFLERNGFAAYKRLMESENTYETRRGGIVRQKRVAVV